jgi:hypothetical protein
MEEQKRHRSTKKTDIKHDEVMTAYKMVISIHGDQARFIAKKILYDETAILTGYTADSVRNILGKMMKCQRKRL